MPLSLKDPVVACHELPQSAEACNAQLGRCHNDYRQGVNECSYEQTFVADSLEAMCAAEGWGDMRAILRSLAREGIVPLAPAEIDALEGEELCQKVAAAASRRGAIGKYNHTRTEIMGKYDANQMKRMYDIAYEAMRRGDSAGAYLSVKREAARFTRSRDVARGVTGKVAAEVLLGAAAAGRDVGRAVGALKPVVRAGKTMAGKIALGAAVGGLAAMAMGGGPAVGAHMVNMAATGAHLVGPSVHFATGAAGHAGALAGAVPAVATDTLADASRWAGDQGYSNLDTASLSAFGIGSASSPARDYPAAQYDRDADDTQRRNEEKAALQAEYRADLANEREMKRARFAEDAVAAEYDDTTERVAPSAKARLSQMRREEYTNTTADAESEDAPTPVFAADADEAESGGDDGEDDDTPLLDSRVRRVSTARATQSVAEMVKNRQQDMQSNE